jgi:hypothetical protein
MFTAEEKTAIAQEIGKQGAELVTQMIKEHNAKVETIAKEIKTNTVSKEQLDELTKLQFDFMERVENIAKEQGKTISDIRSSINNSIASKGKTIASKLKEDYKELEKIHQTGYGIKTYVITANEKGETVMVDINDVNKAAAVHGTIDALDVGSTASILQNFSAQTLLRMPGDAMIENQYRNSPYVFDLCNTITTSINQKVATWIDEQPIEGGSNLVVEGGTKPKAQYTYKIESAQYQKEAQLLSFTEEFHLDFPALEQQILTSGKVDLINNINKKIMPKILNAATTFNIGASIVAAGGFVSPNEFDAINAMTAQANDATFGTANANVALMSNIKKSVIGGLKDNTNGYLNTPDVIKGISFVGNKDFATAAGSNDVVLVGDLKQYNILLRGGLIVKVGHNGNDFAENKFSVVMEQFYFDYISTIRKPALVKGVMATVKTSIEAA